MTDIWKVVEPYLEAESLELDDLELTGSGKGQTLRVVIDGDDVDVERIARVSRGLSRVLDNETDMSDSYQLEVTSPGLERKLRRPQHFIKSVGREVKAKYRNGDTNATVSGVITEADDHAFTMEVDDQAIRVDYGDVLKARTVFRWEKAPKPGH